MKQIWISACPEDARRVMIPIIPSPPATLCAYLQKYVVYRKRKVFFGKQTFGDMLGILMKHKGDQFLLPCSDILKKEIPALLEENELAYTKSIFYRTVCSDLSDLANVNYDMLVFFSPSGIKSLFQNFPEFRQNDTKIAAFGPTTAKAVETAGLTLDLKAPMPNAPSMTMAIEQYIKNCSCFLICCKDLKNTGY